MFLSKKSHIYQVPNRLAKKSYFNIFGKSAVVCCLEMTKILHLSNLSNSHLRNNPTWILIPHQLYCKLYNVWLIFVPTWKYMIECKPADSCIYNRKISCHQTIKIWQSGWAFSGLLPNICHTYPTMMKPGPVIPYLKKTQKLYESRDTLLEFWWHLHFFTGNQKILLYQEIQV